MGSWFPLKRGEAPKPTRRLTIIREKTFELRCAVPCHDRKERPCFFTCVLTLSHREFSHGEYREEAINRASRAGLQPSEIVFEDHASGPSWLFENLFETDSSGGCGTEGSNT